ncbi:hypothetical protein ACWDA3_25085 [Nonomuraea rubra]
MTLRPRLSRIPLWQRHTETVIEILCDALALFVADRPAGEEPELNRAFFMAILKAIRHRHDNGLRVLHTPPIPEARNPPSPDTAGSKAEYKIPDFQWGYIDHQEPDPQRSARHFVIECKRLGNPVSPRWVFNARYIKDGVVRFVSPEWRYGKDVADGAMVGYIQSMSPDAILAEVNAEAAAHGLPPIMQTAPSTGSLHYLGHKLDRDFPVTPFNLTHLWVEALPPPDDLDERSDGSG